MKRNAGMAALVRLGASLLGLLALMLPALAADRALISFIGYSADGDKFAFEEYGVQDGSGFAFSNVYVIDLVNDTWISGTPFAAQAEDEGATLADIRAEALAKADDTLTKLDIGVPAQILMLIGDGVANDNGTRATWSTPSCCGPGQTQPDSFALMLETRGIGSTEDYCRDMSPVGFNLTYQDQNGVKDLHKDGDMLPKSRRCTLDYRLYAVVQPFDDYSGGRRVAIIASYPFGFEGVDRRFLAVPID